MTEKLLSGKLPHNKLLNHISFSGYLLTGDEEFVKASHVLQTWLERGEVNRKNINQFYSMIQCTNAHIRRLLSEKQTHEEELQKMKEKFKNIFEGILRQCKCFDVLFGSWFQTVSSQSKRKQSDALSDSYL